MTDRKAVIKNADMSEDMQQDAVDCATQAIEKYNIEKVRFDRVTVLIEVSSQSLQFFSDTVSLATCIKPVYCF